MNAPEHISPAEVFVFVPSYNHAPFVEKCLKSVIKQTLPPKKLLVIDDGSKDDSPKIIERILRDCPFDAELVVRENRGLCATLNEGFARSSGDYFAYISSDDVWLAAFLQSRTRLLQLRPGAVLSYGHSYLIDEQDQIIDNTKNWGNYTDGNALSMLLRPTIPASASVLYRRENLEKFLWNAESILEDYELYLRLSAAGEFALDENILSAWRIHDYNTSADFPLMMNEWLAAQRRVAPEIGLSGRELEQIQTKIKFRCVADFIRRGQKKEAMKMFWENLSGASSAAAAGKLLFRFFVPTGLLRRRRDLIERQTIKKYGKIEF